MSSPHKGESNMTRDVGQLTRRTVLKSGAVATASFAGFAGTVGAGKGKKGGAGFTFTEPTVDTFEISGGVSDEKYFQRGCGNGGKLQPYSFFHVVDSFDGDGETDRLYPHPSDKRFDDGMYKVNTVCETETKQDRPAYWVQFAPY